jgi:hypothetical protein
MKNISLIVSILLVTTTLQADATSIKQEGVKYIKMLGEELKTNLKAHMKADPTGVEAMGFCAGKAESITKEVNAKLPKGVSVRRSALKTRSEKNIPDITDIKVMEAYQQKAEDKKLTPKDIEIVEVAGATRVYKPLLIKPVCLKCHGDEAKISPEIKAVISKVYPKDMATGFQEGDFRGIIVSEIKKP